MRNVKEEEGNSLVYIMWLLSICGIIILLVVNITGVYLVKQEAATATQQAALAGTAVLMDATDEAVMDFDTDLLKSEKQREDDNFKSIATLLDEEKMKYMQNGSEEQSARIKAYNRVLPPRLEKYPELRSVFEEKFKSGQLASVLNSEINFVLTENGSLANTSEIVLSDDDFRIEVKASSKFDTLSDGKYLDRFSSEITQKGVGPKLEYLKKVY